MPDDEQDLDGLDQGVDESEDLELGGGGDEPPSKQQLSMFERWLAGQLDGTYDAVISKAALKSLRHAVRKASTAIDEAEQRAYDRVRAEFLGDPAAARAEIRAELQAETARARNLGRLGVPPELESLFPEDLDGDFKAWQKRADQLHARGVHWGDADPLVRQVAAARLQAAQQAATQAQQSGQPISLDPSGPVPERIRDAVIAETVLSMANAQAGAQPVDVRSPLEQDIEAAQRNPDVMMREDARQSLVDRFNNELDAISQAQRGAQGGIWGA